MADLTIVRADLLEDKTMRSFLNRPKVLWRGVMATFGIPTSSPWRPDPAMANPHLVQFDLQHVDDDEIRADEDRMETLDSLTDLEALEAVQAEVDFIRPVKPHPVNAAKVPALLSAMWAELAIALVRSRKPSAALRAADVAASFVPVEYFDSDLVASVLEGIALAEIYTGSLETADELLFRASQANGLWNLDHQVLVAAHLWASGEKESADRLLETIVRRAERQRYEGAEQIRDKVRGLRSA